MANQRTIRRSVEMELYTLARRWGVSATFCSVSVANFDPETGDATPTITRHALTNFVSWEASQTQKFAYDLAYVAANVNFTYGALFELGDRVGIIFKPSFVAKINDYIIYDAKRYNIRRMLEIDHHLGYMLHLRETKDQKPLQVITKDIQHWMEFDGNISTS